MSPWTPSSWMLNKKLTHKTKTNSNPFLRKWENARMKRNEERLEDMWDDTEHVNMWMTETERREE